MDWKSERNPKAKHNKERVGGDHESNFNRKNRIEICSAKNYFVIWFQLMQFKTWLVQMHAEGDIKCIHVPIIISRGASESILFDFFHSIVVLIVIVFEWDWKKITRVQKWAQNKEENKKKCYWMAWFWVWSHAI